MQLPNLFRLRVTRTSAPPRPPRRGKRARARTSYVELDDAEDTPLAATIRLPGRLPGPLKIANAAFVEAERRVRDAGVGLLVVATDRPVTGSSETWGGARVVRHPFEDREAEPDAVVLEAVCAAVEDVQAHWASSPGTAVLVHCSAGQNRSAAVVLAVLLAYGVPPEEAVERVRSTRTADGAWSGDDWDKLVGPNGARLRGLVLGKFGGGATADG